MILCDIFKNGNKLPDSMGLLEAKAFCKNSEEPAIFKIQKPDGGYIDAYGPSDTVYLLKLTRNVLEWNLVVKLILKANHGNYPYWWYREIIETGLSAKMDALFGER